jgi:hypothetical protein
VRERVFVEKPGPTEQSYYPDVSVIERPGRGPEGGGRVAAAEVVAEPIVIDVPGAEPVCEGYIEHPRCHIRTSG